MTDAELRAVAALFKPSPWVEWLKTLVAGLLGGGVTLGGVVLTSWLGERRERRREQRVARANLRTAWACLEQAKKDLNAIDHDDPVLPAMKGRHAEAVAAVWSRLAEMRSVESRDSYLDLLDRLEVDLEDLLNPNSLESTRSWDVALPKPRALIKALTESDERLATKVSRWLDDKIKRDRERLQKTQAELERRRTALDRDKAALANEIEAELATPKAPEEKARLENMLRQLRSGQFDDEASAEEPLSAKGTS